MYIHICSMCECVCAHAHLFLKIHYNLTGGELPYGPGIAVRHSRKF